VVWEDSQVEEQSEEKDVSVARIIGAIKFVEVVLVIGIIIALPKSFAVRMA
jgi:hypothetical protein